jgi:retron-type reverse transcriptase
MDSRVQISEVSVKVCRVILPCHPVDAWCGMLLQFEEGARALPSRRRYIPKADGKQRPLGIAAIEDKIVQAAVVAILTPIYEAEFLGLSYGFRPGRSQHDALDALAYGINARKINWILDADISRFFDSLSHAMASA